MDQRSAESTFWTPCGEESLMWTARHIVQGCQWVPECGVSWRPAGQRSEVSWSEPASKCANISTKKMPGLREHWLHVLAQEKRVVGTPRSTGKERDLWRKWEGCCGYTQPREVVQTRRMGAGCEVVQSSLHLLVHVLRLAIHLRVESQRQTDLGF